MRSCKPEIDIKIKDIIYFIKNDPIGYLNIFHFPEILRNTISLSFSSSNFTGYNMFYLSLRNLKGRYHLEKKSLSKLRFKSYCKTLAIEKSYTTGLYLELFWGFVSAMQSYLRWSIKFKNCHECLIESFMLHIIYNTREFRPCIDNSTFSDKLRLPLEIEYYFNGNIDSKDCEDVIGLIFHHCEDSGKNFFKVARLHFIMADCNNRIPVYQTSPIIPEQLKLNYYLVNHYHNERQVTPTVISWNSVQNLNKSNGTKNTGSHLAQKCRYASINIRERNQIDVSMYGYDLSSFLVFGLADFDSEEGLLTKTADEALSTLYSIEVPDRILTIHFGNPGLKINWEEKLNFHKKA